MTSTFALPRKLVVFGLALPLAALVGYLLATPDELNTIALLGLILGVMTIPVFLRSHHPILIFGWNAAITLAFLPGQLPLWIVLAAISISCALLNHAMDKENTFLRVPVLTWPLLFMAAVVLVTAKFTGGVGLRALGSKAYGGKWYVFILLAIAGYFALTSQRIPQKRAKLYAAIFFLSGITSVVGTLAYTLGPSFYFLFYFFPSDVVSHQVVADYTVGMEVVERFGGLAFAGAFAFSFVLARYGIRGIFDLTKPWRVIVFGLIMFASLLGGFRSILIIFALTLVIQFCLEGLHKTRMLLVLLLALVITSALLVPFANKLPLAVQRSLSFLPLELDPVAEWDAKYSLEWRLDMWRILWPEVPRYLLKGKGYSTDATDMYFSVQSARRGFMKTYEEAAVSGNYHNGPLSVLIPFGIWGLLGLTWFLGAGLWALRRNYLYGDPALKTINTFLCAYYITRVIMFFFIFGDLATGLHEFTGLVGLGVSLNGGVRKEGTVAESSPANSRQLATAS